MKSILKATGTGRTATIKLSGGEANRKKKSFPDKIGAKEVRCSFNREKKKKKKDSMCKSLKAESSAINLEWENKGYT